ncbi:YdeI/OmpD-associated family protein [Sphingobacterium bambusae]|uniref:YdeI family protein n=1 Tax=Sphingobacterium bambusae TaxID=662858 RepID=A0ABW6BLC0_9SPHI|nr:YdeI/OmpD-associated family protein [Sphingobacterium bambusae]WPL49943.1 YdeI/OmpD-associated family protein [Sphingobacterium bambusae]
MEEIERIHFLDATAWRSWLIENHEAKDAVWMICYKKSSGKISISWSDAVDQALCFGWIDSIKKSISADASIQFFGKRKSKSTWSKINKEKIEHLTKAGLMTEAGLRSVAVAQENGSWSTLDEVEALQVPRDLERALEEANGLPFFLQLSKSKKKVILQWIVLAKKTETRQKRIEAIARSAAVGQTPQGLF